MAKIMLFVLLSIIVMFSIVGGVEEGEDYLLLKFQINEWIIVNKNISYFISISDSNESTTLVDNFVCDDDAYCKRFDRAFRCVDHFCILENPRDDWTWLRGWTHHSTFIILTMILSEILTRIVYRTNASQLFDLM